MKTRNKIFKMMLLVLLLIGVSACGTRRGEVSFKNYESIVTVNEASGNTIASSYEDVILILGGGFVSSTYDSGSGVVVWEDAEGAIVTITFDQGKVTEKAQTGLYGSI